MELILRIERNITVFLILSAGVLGLTQIIGRYLFNWGVVWGEGIIIMLTVWGALLASASILETKGHVVMDAVVQMLPSRIQKITLFLASILTSVFFIWLCYLSFKNLFFLVEYGGTSLHTYLPAWVEFIGVPISLALGVFHSLAQVVKGIRGFINNGN